MSYIILALIIVWLAKLLDEKVEVIFKKDGEEIGKK